jgi:hypothetical protein
MADVTTSLTTALERAVDNIVDGIAQQGIQVLRRVLDGSGFRDSPYLKNYQLYSHVTGQDILFEIVLDNEAVVPLDDTALKDMNEEISGLMSDFQTKAKQANLQKVARTYGLTDTGSQLIFGRRDARKAPRDARKPARDARKPARPRLKGSEDRFAEHQIMMYKPRGMEIDKTGKLALSFRRATRTTSKFKFVMPQGPLSGIPSDFINQLKTVVAQQFSAELSPLIERYTL